MEIDEESDRESDEKSEEDEVEMVEPAKIKLKQHQLDAIKIMHSNIIDKNTGCIIAHCMGLGKTVTTIHFLNTVKSMQASGETNISNVLILAPKSTIFQWMGESKKKIDYELSTKRDNSPLKFLRITTSE